MKNQYFGDVSDYVKYGLLRCLAESGLALGICWMLTPNDDGRDGKKLNYFDYRDYRDRDRELLDFLRSAVEQGRRDVGIAESYALIPGARYFPETVPDRFADRTAWFSRALTTLATADVLFFDPDNGFEITSRPIGRRGSSKFMAWREVTAAFESGSSLMVFQHWAREDRNIHVTRLRSRLAEITRDADVRVIRTKNVAYFLLVQSDHRDRVDRGLATALRRWAGLMAGDTPPYGPLL